MAITDKEEGVWELDQVYNKINQGGIWSYDGDQQMWGWGRNDNGGLGLNNVVDYSSPTQIPGTNWEGASTGGNETLAIKTDGTMWSWGDNTYGQLGNNSQTDYSSPTQVGTDTNWSACTLNMQDHSSMAVRTDGTLWVWGNNDYGKLAQNQGPVGLGNQSSPIQIGSGTDWATGWNSLNLGNYTAYAIKTDGTLWSWGYNYAGSMGISPAPTSRSSPVQIGTETTWASTGLNYSHFAAIKTDGTLWVAGGGSYGALAQNNTTSYSSPRQVPGTTWRCVAGHDDGMLATKTDGTLWAWGRNANGQLGQNNTTNYSSPRQVPGSTWDRVTSVWDGALMLKTDGTIWAMGQNHYGQLGQNQSNPARGPVSSPVQIGTDTDWGGRTSQQNVAQAYLAFKTK